MGGAVAADQTMQWLGYLPARRLLARLDAAMAEMLQCTEPRLTELAGQLVRRGGKRLRPALLFTAAGLAAPAADDQDLAQAGALQAAAAAELLHVAALYHDDVMDRAQIRRGQRTINAVRGDAAAVTAGTFVFARVMRVLCGLDGRLAAWAGQAALALTLGQLQEAENIHNLDHRLESYLQVAARKTAALFEFCCRAGAHLAGGTDAVIEAVGLYGRALGLAFQAADDTLDLVAAEQELGKRPGIDLREGVYGLPVLLALHHNPSPGTGRLREILAGEQLSQADEQEARQLVVAAGGVAGAFHITRQYAQQAAAHLTGIPGGPARASLLRLADYVVTRDR